MKTISIVLFCAAASGSACASSTETTGNELGTWVANLLGTSSATNPSTTPETATDGTGKEIMIEDES